MSVLPVEISVHHCPNTTALRSRHISLDSKVLWIHLYTVLSLEH